MEKKLLSYKGFTGTIQCNFEDNILYGHVLYIRDFIAYEGKTLKALEKNFHDTLDEYIQDCKDAGLEPDKPFSGQLSLRISPETHKKLSQKAFESNTSINEFVGKIIEEKLKNETTLKHTFLIEKIEVSKVMNWKESVNASIGNNDERLQTWITN